MTGETPRWRRLVTAIVAASCALGAALAAAAGSAPGGAGATKAVTGAGSQSVDAASAISDDYAAAVALQRDGRIVAAGVGGPEDFDDDSDLALDPDFALARYTPGGRLDPSFGTAGRVLTHFGDDDDAAAVALQRDGKIVVAGESGELFARFALARYTQSGRVDASFGTGGKVLTEFAANRFAGASAVAIQGDGKIVAVGHSRLSIEAASDFALVRYTPDGRLDPSFGSGARS